MADRFLKHGDGMERDASLEKGLERAKKLFLKKSPATIMDTRETVPAVSCSLLLKIAADVVLGVMFWSVESFFPEAIFAFPLFAMTISGWEVYIFDSVLFVSEKILTDFRVHSDRSFYVR